MIGEMVELCRQARTPDERPEPENVVDEMTEALAEGVSAAVGTWGLELIPEAERLAAEVPAAEGLEPGDIHRLTEAMVLELGVTVGSGVIATIAASDDTPAWVPARIVWSASAEAVAPKIKQHESVLIEAATRRAVDIQRYTEAIAASQQAQAVAQQYGFSPQQAREVADDVAKKLAAKHQRFIAEAVPLVVAKAFGTGSLARLKALLEEHARPAAASRPPASDGATPGGAAPASRAVLECPSCKTSLSEEHQIGAGEGADVMANLGIMVVKLRCPGCHTVLDVTLPSGYEWRAPIDIPGWGTFPRPGHPRR